MPNVLEVELNLRKKFLQDSFEVQCFFNLPLHKHDWTNSYEHNVFLTILSVTYIGNSLVYSTSKLKSPKPWLLYIILSINVSLLYCSQKYGCTLNFIQNDPCDFSTLIGLNLPFFIIQSITTVYLHEITVISQRHSHHLMEPAFLVMGKRAPGLAATLIK